MDNNNCPCGFGAESAEHVLTECPHFIEGRPPDWTSHTRSHTVHEEGYGELWEMENPMLKARRTN